MLMETTKIYTLSNQLIDSKTRNGFHFFKRKVKQCTIDGLWMVVFLEKNYYIPNVSCVLNKL